MRSNTSAISARRHRRNSARRTRRRPAFVAGALAFAVLATAGITATTPLSQAEASGLNGTFGSFALASYSPMASPTVAPSAAALDAKSQAALEALDAAADALEAAEIVLKDIEASGLDIGEDDPSIDTADLETAVEHLRSATDERSPFLSDVTDRAAALIDPVTERVASLQGRLDAAKAAEAKRIAEEKARKAAAAAAAAAAKSQAGSSAPSPRYAAGGTSAAQAQAIARQMLAARGWGDDQFACLVSLWNKESGWNYQAYNASSGAYGIPQALPGSKMATAGADWQTNAATQISWGLGYISGRYGTPCGAWSHSVNYGWY